MVRRISASQLRTQLRQVQQKQRQGIAKYNQAVRQHNQKVKQTVNKYNQEARAYNARVRANRQRLLNELARLNRQPTTVTGYVRYRASVRTLHETYMRLEHRDETQQLDRTYNRVLDLSEREAANSLEVTNRLLGADTYSAEYADTLQDASLLDRLRQVSEDLDDRWQGAVFALNPRNPDAARHFCTSAREVITQILEIKAPDADVISLQPDCDKTDQGKPTRRAKIKYVLHRKGMTEKTLEEFVEQDVGNIMQLFYLLNDGTHGFAGAFDLQQLGAIRKRVGDSIMFLTELAGDT